MNMKSKKGVFLAALLAVLLLLGILLPLLASTTNAIYTWEEYEAMGLPPPKPYVAPPKNSTYFENTYSEEDATDMNHLQGGPVINSIDMSVSSDGNIKLTANVRYRYKLFYCWQAWSDEGTDYIGDDRWINIGEATEASFRPADFLQNGSQMVRLTLSHSGGGSVVSTPVIITIGDGAGDNAGFTGPMNKLFESARASGYYFAAFATNDGIIGKAIE